MKRSFLRDIPKDKLGYYGLHKWLVIWGQEERIPVWVARLYWKFQPIRCVFGWHNWYDTAAGLCSACVQCHKEEPYPKSLLHKYRFNRTALKLAALLDEEQVRARVMEEAWVECLERNVSDNPE